MARYKNTNLNKILCRIQMSYRTLANVGVNNRSSQSVNVEGVGETKIINVPVISCIEDKKSLISNNRFCVIDVYAEWCEPCNVIKPQFEKLVEKYTIPNICVLAKENVELRLSPEVQVVPTFLFYKDGELDSMINGGNMINIEKKINEFLLTLK
jgi:thiol-disulfide isomerase/thioredoxin